MIFKSLRLGGRIGKAQSLLIKKKYPEAIDFLEEILSFDPPDYLEVTALMQKGEAEYYLGLTEKALASFEKAVSTYETFPKKECISKDNNVIGRAVTFIELINGNRT